MTMVKMQMKMKMQMLNKNPLQDYVFERKSSSKTKRASCVGDVHYNKKYEYNPL